jgi:hypothetical protein
MTMKDEKKSTIANEIGKTCGIFAKDPEKRMRGLEPDDSRW